MYTIWTLEPYCYYAFPRTICCISQRFEHWRQNIHIRISRKCLTDWSETGELLSSLFVREVGTPNNFYNHREFLCASLFKKNNFPNYVGCITKSVINLHIIREQTYCETMLKETPCVETVSTWCVQVLRSPNLFKKNYSPQEAENAVISQRNHPVDVHIFHNAHATIAWPQQKLL